MVEREQIKPKKPLHPVNETALWFPIIIQGLNYAIDDLKRNVRDGHKNAKFYSTVSEVKGHVSGRYMAFK